MTNDHGSSGWRAHDANLRRYRMRAALQPRPDRRSSLASSALAAQDGQWLMYSGSYARTGSRRSRRSRPPTSRRLKPVWVYQPPGTGSVECARRLSPTA